MELYVVRHGETIWNVQRRFQGQTDIELNERGREYAGVTGAALEEVPFDVIYSSPLIRAYETACLIRGHRNIPIVRDERLKEMSFGVYEGGDTRKLFADESDPFHYFFTAPEKYEAPEGGESLQQLTERTTSFLQEMIEANEERYRRVMIVAHGAANRALMKHIQGFEYKDFWTCPFQYNCSVNIIRLEHGVYTTLEEAKVYYPLSEEDLQKKNSSRNA